MKITHLWCILVLFGAYYSHYMYNTYPIPTAASRTAPWLRVTLWGWGKCSVPHRVELIWPRTQAPCPVRLSSTVKFISYRGIEGENAHFQPSAWGFLTTKHSRRFANDVALALREKILAGSWLGVANRL